MAKQWRFCMALAREVLRLKFTTNKSNREIGSIHSISKSTVAVYIKRASSVGIINLDKLNSTSEDELKQIIFPTNSGPQGQVSEVDFNWIHLELKKKHVTLKLLWKELAEKDKNIYKYSRFCDLYRQWKSTKDISMRIVHKAGEKAFIDYAGTTMPIVVNTKTGEVKEAQIFLSVLGASNYTYAEATWSQGTHDFLASNIRAFEYFGGVPEVLVPDNLKAGVNIACKYEPVINRSYREMAKHYSAVVIPARVRKPKDKAKVEGGVLIASRWILAALRNRTFFSLEELNEAIWELLEELNTKAFQKLEGSRRSVFDEIERSELKALPTSRFEIAEWKKVKVNIDYHVQVESCFYSVPYQLRGKQLDCRYTQRTVEIFDQGKRVASHLRSHKVNTTITNSEHMPKSHREHLEWSPSRMLKWGASIGQYTEILFKKLMDYQEHPELAYKSCLGITRLEKNYGKERLEKACGRAVRLGAISYKSVKSILEKNLDSQPVNGEQQDLPLQHENIRGGGYYN